jgi:hypothetical protein
LLKQLWQQHHHCYPWPSFPWKPWKLILASFNLNPNFKRMVHI